MDFESEDLDQFDDIDQWRVATEPLAWMSFTISELGEDFIFITRRLDFSTMVLFGELPQRLTEVALKGVEIGDEALAVELWNDLPLEEQLKTSAFVQKIVMSVCVQPRIVESDAPGEGELSYQTMPRRLISLLAAYALKGSPGVPFVEEMIN
jgi:hypothetical protein